MSIMNLSDMLEAFQKLKEKEQSTKGSLGKLIDILEELDHKNIKEDEKARIENALSAYMKNMSSIEDAKAILKELRNVLADIGFVGSNYYLILGVGMGVALGSALGISFGTPYENGVVWGPLIGSSIGLIGGLVFGMYLDRKKEFENHVLKTL